jgi:hypothetical protein
MSDEQLEYQSPTDPDATKGAETRAVAGAASEAAGGVGGAVRRVLHQPTFIAAVVLLLTAALGLNASVQFMKLHFKKDAVPLAHELGSISDHLGSWVQVTQDQALDKETQDVLATDKYIFRSYVDSRIVLPDTIDREFKEKSIDERAAALERHRRINPAAVVSISVTYYTGLVDTVAHVPDRCVTADGYEPKSYKVEKWPIARDLPRASKGSDGDDVELRYINFEDQTGTSNVNRAIAYFFHCNGGFVSDPLGVRRRLANLLETRGYYCKIEVMTTVPNEQEAARVMTDFLTSAMPEIVRCMPDWNKPQTPTPAKVAMK